MQARGRGGNQPPIGIALEGDLGNRIDVALAVAMLNGLAARGEARHVAFAISRTSLKTAQVADVLAGFYASRPPGATAVSMVGMPELGPKDDNPPIGAMLARSADGTPVYASGIGSLIDTADNAVWIRNILLAQHDGNAAIVLAGPATGLVRMLGLLGARPQIQAKVSRLVVAMGAYPNGAPDSTVKDDLAAARTLFAEWPTPIVAVGAEVGEALRYPGFSIDIDLAWAPNHPLADAYRAFGAMPYDAPTTALAAVLHAVHPEESYFTLSEPGTISVQDDGRTRFTPGAGGGHRYLKVDEAQKDRVIKLYTDLVSARPVPRPGRRGAPPAQQQQQQQQQPQAPPAVPPATPPPAS